MAERHKWADVIIAMANGETGQWLCPAGRWEDGVNYNPMSNPEYEWRIKPRTIMIGDMEVPEPLREAPKIGTRYFIPNMTSDSRSSSFVWEDFSGDYRFLSHGIAHLEKQSAETHALALIKISGGNV